MVDLQLHSPGRSLLNVVESGVLPAPRGRKFSGLIESANNPAHMIMGLAHLLQIGGHGRSGRYWRVEERRVVVLVQ